MANRKLDMGRAWSQATGLIGTNRDLVMVLAGIFLFIPLFVFALALLSSAVDFGGAGAEPDPERIREQINAVLIANWWALLLAAVGQLCGGIAIIALLGDRSRPTVSEVLKMVPRLILPVFGAQVLVALATQGFAIIFGLLPEGVAAAGNLLTFPISLYLTVKFCLVIAAIVLGHQSNPVAAMRESWRVTKANSLRLLGFFALLVVLAAVIGLIATLIVGLLLSALGEHAETIGNAAFIALLMTVFYTVSFALTVSIYRQLSDPAPERDVDLFE